MSRSSGIADVKKENRNTISFVHSSLQSNNGRCRPDGSISKPLPLSGKRKKWYFPLAIAFWHHYCQRVASLSPEHRGHKENEPQQFSYKHYWSSSSWKYQEKQSNTSNADTRFDQLAHYVDYSSKKNRCPCCQKTANFKCIKCSVNLHPKTVLSLITPNEWR